MNIPHKPACRTTVLGWLRSANFAVNGHRSFRRAIAALSQQAILFSKDSSWILQYTVLRCNSSFTLFFCSSSTLLTSNTSNANQRMKNCNLGFFSLQKSGHHVSTNAPLRHKSDEKKTTKNRKTCAKLKKKRRANLGRVMQMQYPGWILSIDSSA